MPPPCRNAFGPPGARAGIRRLPPLPWPRRRRRRYNVPHPSRIETPRPHDPKHPPPRSSAALPALRRIRGDDGGADGADRALDRRHAAGAAADPRGVRHRRRQPPAARPHQLRRRLRHRPALPRAAQRLASAASRCSLSASRSSRSPPSPASSPAASRLCSPPASCRASPTPRRGSSRWRWCATSTAGRRMAEVMSFVMMVFIVVPVIAPTLGGAVPARRQLAPDLRLPLRLRPRRPRLDRRCACPRPARRDAREPMSLALGRPRLRRRR